MRYCRSDWPGLYLFCCYQPECVVSQQSCFWACCFISFSILLPPPPEIILDNRAYNPPPPQGALVTNANILASVTATMANLNFAPSAAVLTHRPLSATVRCLHFAALASGATLYFSSGVRGGSGCSSSCSSYFLFLLLVFLGFEALFKLKKYGYFLLLFIYSHFFFVFFIPSRFPCSNNCLAISKLPSPTSSSPPPHSSIR